MTGDWLKKFLLRWLSYIKKQPNIAQEGRLRSPRAGNGRAAGRLAVVFRRGDGRAPDYFRRAVLQTVTRDARG